LPDLTPTCYVNYYEPYNAQTNTNGALIYSATVNGQGKIPLWMTGLIVRATAKNGDINSRSFAYFDGSN